MLYFLHSTPILSSYIDVVVTLSITYYPTILDQGICITMAIKYNEMFYKHTSQYDLQKHETSFTHLFDLWPEGYYVCPSLSVSLSVCPPVRPYNQACVHPITLNIFFKIFFNIGWDILVCISQFTKYVPNWRIRDFDILHFMHSWSNFETYELEICYGGTFH